MKIDTARSGVQNLLDEINTDNAVTVYTQDAVRVSFPVPWTSMTDTHRNTEVVVTGIPEQGLLDSVTFHYRRPTLKQVFAPLPKLTVAPGATLEDVWTQLRSTYDFIRADLQFDVSVLEAYPSDVLRLDLTVSADPGSYAYTDSVPVTLFHPDYPTTRSTDTGRARTTSTGAPRTLSVV